MEARLDWETATILTNINIVAESKKHFPRITSNEIPASVAV